MDVCEDVLSCSSGIVLQCSHCPWTWVWLWGWHQRMLRDEGTGGLKCPLFSQHSSTSGGGVLATTGVSELPSYFSKNNDCEKKIILCKAKICWVHQACQKSATVWHLLRSIQLLPVTRSSPLRHHLTHTLCSAVRKWNSRDLLQWLTSRDYPGLSVLFRSHASPAPYLPSCRWAGSGAGSGESTPNTSHRVRAAAPAACALAHTEVFFSESTLLLSVLSGNRNVCDYVWRKLGLGE